MEDIEDNVGEPEKLLMVNCTKTEIKLCLSSKCRGEKSYLYFNKAQIY